MSNVVAHPAEALEISPEALEVANCYLQLQDITKVALELDVSRELVTRTLARREVKAYVDQVFYDLGFNNRFKMREVLDEVIKQKLREMDEAGVGSNKDIIEILALSHKMYMEQVQAELKLAQLQQKTDQVRTQVNVQVNDNSQGGSNYSNLLDRILNANV